MGSFRRFARRLRHQPALEHAEWLWSALRGPYHSFLNLPGNGVSVLVGGVAGVRMPTEFIGGSWEDYEPESVAALTDWVRGHPEGVVLDIGCSIGIYSALALFANPTVSVVAFDADIASIRAARRMTKNASGDRLRCVFGFIAADATDHGSLSNAIETTSRLINSTEMGGTEMQYVCIGDPSAEDVPRRRLDDLFQTGFEGRSCLIKCDVEGAEQIVLSGATKVLSQYHRELLLSVHPPVLSDYGHSKETLRALLTDLGYGVNCVAVDHEEHWLCSCIA